MSARKLAARTLESFPNAKTAVKRLERDLRQERAPLRGVTQAISGDPYAETRLAAVLDGRTLNIDMRVAGVRPGDVVAAELRIARGSVRRSVPAHVRREPDGGCAVDATALLDDGPGGWALRPGARWRLELWLRTAARGDLAIRVLGDHRWTVTPPPHPDTGYRYRIRLGVSGRLALVATPPAPTAELSRTRFDWLQAGLEVRLVGRPLATPAAVEIATPDGAGRVTVPAERIGADRVGCVLPVAELADLSGGDGLHVFLRSGRRRLRVGRVLHDLDPAARVLRPTTSLVWSGPGRSVRVAVRYTAAGTMTLACESLVFEDCPV